MKVDYVQQMMEIQRGLMAKAEATKSMWQDEVANRYYRDYIEYYDKYISNYLEGKDITGMGLEDLLNFFEEKTQKMTELTGCPSPLSGFVGGDGEVHDQYLNRNMSGFDRDVPNPDYLDDEKVRAIEDDRTDNDNHGRMESPFSEAEMKKWNSEHTHKEGMDSNEREYPNPNILLYMMQNSR